MEERLNALNIALKNESSERDFYLKNAERTRNPLGKAMFEQIADEELEHYERLKELHDRWAKEGKWPETLPLKVKNTSVKNVLAKVVKTVSQMPQGDDDDLKALQTAIEFEAKGTAFYARLRDEVSNPQEKAFFDLLASIEREHYNSLKDTEQFLTNPAAWYQEKERSGLDGA
ncbi:Rubrerythrin [Syntrophus gentianae]|uniref:Rubrerythrin n=1 Tax=Syntrophus gentianae TaxID=43775 RepID=A0A1H7WRZ9_9BACT|nr:ferritin family protein [Syntrophus gentianae]SEM24144.1 Rubrerythrin [Syntrophus gentianae]